MTRRPAGFSLCEVLLALLVITVGLLGFAATLGPSAALTGQGRAKGRIALVLESRMDRLRRELSAGAPACLPPASGSLLHPDGVLEAWSSAASAGVIALRVQAGIPGKGAPDTLLTSLACP